MDKRLKIGAATLCVSFLALSLLLVYPSPGSVRMRGIVFASGEFGENTKVVYIYIENTTYGLINSFYENNETDNIEVGEIVGRLEVCVGISKEYASTQAQAENWTRVYITIENPSEEVVYENYLENQGLSSEYANHFEIWHRSIVCVPFELTEGNWTITTKYDVYA